MTPEQKLELAAQILNRGKALAPDRFPKPDPAVAQAWADALSRFFESMPIGVWPEAVDLWATELAGDRMVTPKELKQAAHSVRDRWEVDPRRKNALNAHREARQELIDRQISDGTLLTLRGHQPPKTATPINPPPNIRDIIAKATRKDPQ